MKFKRYTEETKEDGTLSWDEIQLRDGVYRMVNHYGDVRFIAIRHETCEYILIDPNA